MININGFSCEELGVTDEALTAHASLRFYDVRTTDKFRVYGLYDYKNGDHFIRLPENVAEKVSEGVNTLNYHTAGGRVRFVTDSDYIAVRAYYPKFSLCCNMTPIGSSGFDIYVERGGKDVFEGVIRPFGAPVTTPHSCGDGVIGILALPKGRKAITLNLPLHQQMDKLYIGLDSDSTLERRADYRFEKPVLYYGSSITQGVCSSRPGIAYEAQISRKLDCDFINLGFAGKCLGEEAMADYIATLDPSVFVYDYDHNSTNLNHYRSTHESLYLKFRAAHPDTPVIFVGRPDFWFKGYLNAPLPENNREILYATYKNAFDRGENVYYIDGYALFDGEDREECTNDGVHPNDLGMYKMANHIGRYVEMALTPHKASITEADVVHP